MADVCAGWADVLEDRGARHGVDVTRAAELLRTLPGIGGHARARRPQPRQHPVAREASGWLAIDPKPMRGDPAYDLWPLLEQVDDPFEHPDPAAVLRERVALLAGLLDLDPDRVAAWAFARSTESALWVLGPARRRARRAGGPRPGRGLGPGGGLIRSTTVPGACTCSNTRLVCVWATSGRVLRCSSTNARSSRESRTATCTSTSSTPASRYTSRTSGRWASRCATSASRARADGLQPHGDHRLQPATDRLRDRPGRGSRAARPDSRSARTRAWQVDGAMPAAAASSLLEIRPSRSSSLSSRRSTSSSSTAPNVVRRAPVEACWAES